MIFKNILAVSIFDLLFIFTESLYGEKIFVMNVENQKDLIIDGSNGKIKDFPYQIYMRTEKPNGSYSFCGGSIITSEHILTAAHCLKHSKSLNDIQVYTGIDRLSSQNLQNPLLLHLVKEIIIHPKYSFTTKQHDITILTLSKPIIFNRKQRPINLPRRNVKIHAMANATGFGRIDGEKGSSSTELQVVKLQTLPPEDCESRYNRFRFDSHVCAKGVTEMGSICKGDSGGALAIKDTIIGIASFGKRKKCGFGIPTGFVDVYKHMNFIESVIGK